MKAGQLKFDKGTSNVIITHAAILTVSQAELVTTLAIFMVCTAPTQLLSFRQTKPINCKCYFKSSTTWFTLPLWHCQAKNCKTELHCRERLQIIWDCVDQMELPCSCPKSDYSRYRFSLKRKRLGLWCLGSHYSPRGWLHTTSCQLNHTMFTHCWTWSVSPCTWGCVNTKHRWDSQPHLQW